MDESRKAFEQWFNPRKIAMQKIGISTIRIVRLHKKMLEAWTASRASIEIDAPAEPFYPMPKENSQADHYQYGRQSIISKVRAAGIKVKE